MPPFSDVPPLLLARLTNVAILAAQHAGEVLKKAFNSPYEITFKEGRHNLVTQYDTEIENLIIAFIKKHFPEHNFLAEESGSQGDFSADILWIIDPIDGTVNFAHNIPLFSVSIAATFQGQVLSGVVYNPLTSELFVAEKNNGAYLNGVPITVSKIEVLADGMLATGFPYCVHENPLNCIDHFVSFTKLGVPIRRLGSAALDMAYVAAGRFDGFWEVSLKPWDFAAGKLLIEEAGGLVTNYAKEALVITQSSPVLASNQHLHDQMLQHLKVS
jgi:myo-inositol-1(or 4)-monophosphatase